MLCEWWWREVLQCRQGGEVSRWKWRSGEARGSLGTGKGETEEPPRFRCRYCPLRFIDGISRRHHALGHRQEMRFSFSWCGYRTNSSSVLKYHVRRHLNKGGLVSEDNGMLDEELLSKYTDVLPQKRKKRKPQTSAAHYAISRVWGEVRWYLMSGVWGEVHDSKAPRRAPIHEPRSRPVPRVSHVRVPYESPVPAVPTRAHPREELNTGATTHIFCESDFADGKESKTTAHMDEHDTSSVRCWRGHGLNGGANSMQNSPQVQPALPPVPACG
ncbi:Zinc finger C2H2-type [Trinorchestia longiramus]|nr:Zinc finger C2H2-type [Trinorchestia longiramus]